MSWTPSVAARHRYRIGGRICIHVCGDIGGVAANREACGSGASMKLPGSNCRVWCHLLSHNGPPFRYEFRSFWMAPAPPRRSPRSQDERNECFDSLLILRVRFAKVPFQQFLFLSGFQPKSNKKDGEQNKSGHTATEYRHTEEHEENTAINRMAHVSIRPALDQFMVRFERDSGTPVATQYNTRPLG